MNEVWGGEARIIEAEAGGTSSRRKSFGGADLAPHCIFASTTERQARAYEDTTDHQESYLNLVVSACSTIADHLESTYSNTLERRSDKHDIDVVPMPSPID